MSDERWLEDRLRTELGGVAVPPRERWYRAREGSYRPSAALRSLAAFAAVLLVVATAVIAGTLLRERRVPDGNAANPPPPAIAIKAPPIAGTSHLVYAISTRDGQRWGTQVYRLDPQRPVPVLLATLAAQTTPPAVFVSPTGSIYAFGAEPSYVVRLPARFQGSGLPLLAPGAPGPARDVRSMQFAGGRTFATTPSELIELIDPPDLAQFPSVRVVAPVGGEILGELEDGRLLLASHALSREMTFNAVRPDGVFERLASVTGALGPVAATGHQVLVLRNLRPNEDRAGVTTIVNVDLETAAERSSQPVGDPTYLSFAGMRQRAGYVFTDPKAFFAGGEYDGLVPLGARGAAGRSWDHQELTRHRLPMLDTRQSWSPDDRYLAFRTGEDFRRASGEREPLTPAAQGLALYGADHRRIFEVTPIPGAVTAIVGWIGGQR